MLKRHLRLVASLVFIACASQAAGKDVEAARKLLDGAVEMASGVHPETGVAALMRAGAAYAAVDKKTALALLSRAFSAVSALTAGDIREEYAAGIVRAAADLDVRTATELLRQVPNPASAATAVVRQLLAGKRFDEAMELLALLPEQVEYPYEAASLIIVHLPEDDPRRAITFGRATAAYIRVPAGPFPEMVERFGKTMAADLRDRAVSIMLQRIRVWKDASESFSGNANDDESEVEIHSHQQNELREMVSVARIFEPAAVGRIVAERNDIAAALAGFRKPRKPAEPFVIHSAKKDDEEEVFSPPFGIGMADSFESFQQRINDYGKAAKQAGSIAQLLKKDPAEAVRVAVGLPEIIRAEALAVIASAVLAKDPALATSVVDRCVSEIGHIGNPAARIPALVKLGAIYARLKDSPRAYAAYERAMADAVPLWSNDTRADRPNMASRDTWPSTQAVRTAAHEAAVSLGAEAEGLLSGIAVNDLALFARIHMARGLLGLPLAIHHINVRWVDEKK